MITLKPVLMLLLVFTLLGTDVLAQDYRRRRRSESEEQNAQPAEQPRTTPADANTNPPEIQTTGILRGSVIDAFEVEPIIGATVQIMSLKRGANTDIDGVFNLYDLPPGAYLVKVSSISNAPDSQLVTIEAGKVTTLDIKLRPNIQELDAVEISARKLVNNEAIMLVEQMRSPLILNGISREEFRRNGDRSAAAAMRRIVGVTVEDGRYLQVRGLGDRYSKVMLQGAEIPSLDPERNAVQMDLFPTSIIENMIVYKTQNADLPGDFSGGLLNISLRDFPDRFQLSVRSSVGLNTQAFNADDFLTYNEHSAAARFGLNDPVMARPDSYNPDEPFPTNVGPNADVNRLDRVTREWGSDMAATADPGVRLNHNHSISMGGQTRLFGRPLGINGAFTYRRNFNHYSDGLRGGFTLPGSVADTDVLNPAYEFDEMASGEIVRLGGLVMLSYKPTDNTKMRLFYMHNRSSELFSMYQEGTYGEDGSDIIRRNNTSGYTARGVQTGYFSIEHVFRGLNDLRANLLFSRTLATQNEPDLRFYTDNVVLDAAGNPIDYVIDASQFFPPSRYYRDMREVTNADVRLNLELPFNLSNRTGAIKAGGAFTDKFREFDENRYEYRFDPGFLADYDGTAQYLFGEDQLGFVDQNENGTFESDEDQVTMRDVSLVANNYEATQTIAAAYLMADLPVTRRFRALVGVRMETTQINVDNITLANDEGQLNELDFLPSLNLVYALRENMNLRASYGRSIARPTFRELAPFVSFNFVGEFQLLGNRNLERTIVDNVELRWEMFPNPGEIISLGAFYKQLQNPIERILTLAQNPQIQYANLPEAEVYGAEFEIRKNLGFIAPVMNNFRIGFNASYIFSQVDISEQELQQIRAQEPGADTRRPMFMQSPYVVNASLGYNQPEIGTDINLVFNVFGERLTTISRGAAPNIFEQPRPSLDFVFNQNLGIFGVEAAENWSINFRARNLLNPRYQLRQVYKGEEYFFSDYTIGRIFSLGVIYTIQ